MIKNLRQAIKGSLIYSLGNISTKLVGLILLPVFVEALTISEYGIFGILEVTVQILVSIFGLGIWYAFERWYWDKDYRKQQKSILFTLQLFSLLIGVFLFFGIFLFSSKLSNLLFDDTSYAYVLMLMAIIAGLEIFTQTPATLLRLRNKSVQFTISFIAKLVTMLVFTLYFIIVKGKKIDGIYEAQLIASVVYLVILFFPMVKNIEIKLEIAVLGDMIRYRLPLVFSSVFIIILSFTDRYALKFLGELSDVGVYSLGYKLANAVKVIIVSSAWFAISPMIYRMMDQPGNKRFYSKVMTYFTFGVLIFVMGISIFGKEIVYLFASKPEYRASFTVIPVISFAIVFGMLKDVALTGLNITKKTKIIAGIIVVIALINLGLNILIIPYLQYIGTAITTLVSQMLFFILVMRYAQKEYHVPYEIKKVVLMICLAAGLVISANLFNSWYLGFRIMAKLLIIFSFPIILYFVGFYEEVELESLKSAWKKWRNPRRWRMNLKEVIEKEELD